MNFGKPKRQKSRLAARISNLNLAFLALILSLITAVVIVLINGINTDTSLNLVHAYSMEASDKFYSYISQDLALVRKTSFSRALTGWFADEGDEDKRSHAFDEIMTYTDILQESRLYFGIRKTMNEYAVEGGAELADLLPISRLNPSNPDDIWYFECLDSPTDYTVKIDAEKASQTWRLWINHKVMADGELVGVFCSGLRIPDVFHRIFGNFEESKVRGYIIDKRGIIQLDSGAHDAHTKEYKPHLADVNPDPLFSRELDAYLERINGFETDHSTPVIVKLSKGPYTYAAIEPVTNIGWSVVVFYNSSALFGIKDYLPLFTVMLLGLFLYVIGRDILMNRFVFKPLGSLIQHVSKNRWDNTDLFDNKRDDEIGELARTIRNVNNDRQHQERLLHAVNSSAVILLATVNEEGFEKSLLEGMEIIGSCMDVDRLHIWRNEIIDGTLYYVRELYWENEFGRRQNPIPEKHSYSENPEWERLFRGGQCASGPLKTRTEQEQNILGPLNIKSILAIPIYLRNQLYGVFSLDDCHNERYFTEAEIKILRSVGLMMISALKRTRLQEELKAALKEAQTANQAKTSFLANMSHEMRTPLNAVIGLSELIMDEGILMNEEATINMEKIYNAGVTLLSTVNDILDISKIEAGKFELIPVEYDIPSLINDAIAQSIMRIGDKPIQFILNIDENLPTRLYGDDLRIKQILNNLLSNAFKYTQKGTVELTMLCEHADDTVWLIAQVRDTGTGIRNEDIPNLFTDYTQMDKKTNRQIEGTGLGLPITKKVAEMMGGWVGVESVYGKGSTFTIRLRQKYVSSDIIGPEVVNNLKKHRYSENRRRRNLHLMRIKLPYAKVLVVDDVITNLDVAKGIMKPYGMQIDCVTSGQEAIDTIREEKIRYNAIFMDHMMPGIDGIEAARIIREEIGTEYARTIPIIALTANAIVGNEEMFLSNGFQAFIPKPIEIARLDSVLRQWVRDKTLEDEFRIENIDQMEKAMGTGVFEYQIEGVDLQKGLERFSGDEESFLQVLHSYTVNTPPLLDKARVVTRENLADYAIIVHGIKSSSRGICAEAAGARAEVLEKAAKERNLNFVVDNNGAFLEIVENLTSSLQRLLKEISSKEKKPKKDKPDGELLQKLYAACEIYDMDGVDAAMAEIERFEYENDDGLSEWLRTNVDQVNFTQIREKLISEKLVVMGG